MTSSDYKEPMVVCYDARGNGRGGCVPTLTGDHQNRITDYTAILCYNDRRRADYHSVDDEIAPAVVAKYGTGGGNTPLIVIGNTNSNAAIIDDETAPTLLGTRGGARRDANRPAGNR